MKMVVSRRLGAFALAVLCAAGLGGSVQADFTYQSASRVVYASASTSYPLDGHSPEFDGTSALGFFQSGAWAWASGDYFSESHAWQRSNLSSSAIRVEMAARTSVAGFPIPGEFSAFAESHVTTRFTLDERTPYWLIMQAQFEDGSGGSVEITGGPTVVSASGIGSWEGFLEAGTYMLTASRSASNWYSYGNGPFLVANGWSSITIGVPAPATASLLALCGFARRRRRRV
jgi:hypothetical protein